VPDNAGIAEDTEPFRRELLAPVAERLSEPTAAEARALLDQYIKAFDNADAAALERLLLGSPGDWRMRPTSANGQPAAAVRHRGEHRRRRLRRVPGAGRGRGRSGARGLVR
jgi:hypothetical protein